MDCLHALTILAVVEAILLKQYGKSIFMICLCCAKKLGMDCLHALTIHAFAEAILHKEYGKSVFMIFFMLSKKLKEELSTL